MEIAIGIILILASVFLIAAVLLQEGKNRNLSGAIGGGTADTYLGKSGAKSMDKLLSRLTTVVAIVFVVLVLVMYLMQDTNDYAGVTPPVGEDAVVSDTLPAEGETTAAGEGAETTAAPETTVAA